MSAFDPRPPRIMDESAKADERSPWPTAAPPCHFGRCDGSGEFQISVEIFGHVYRHSDPCDCAKRDTIPTRSPDMSCRDWGCEGCPSCFGPGYVP